MADTDWTNEELASIDRIPRYNILDPAAGGDAYSFGGDGYLDNQMRQTVDALIVARGARRMALSASSAAIQAAQEAASAKAERMAAQNAATNAYNSAQDAAAKVALAAAEADRAKAQADLAKALATGLKLPAVTPEMAGRFMKVNADGTAYELGLVTIATSAELKSGTGTGFANAQNLQPVLLDIGPNVGDMMESLKLAGAGSASWLECNGSVYSKALYPDLFAAIGHQFADFISLANSSTYNAGYASSDVLYDGNLTLIGIPASGGTNVDKVLKSTNDFVNYTTIAGGSHNRATVGRILKFKGSYVVLPYNLYTNSYGTMVSLYSSDGLATLTPVQEVNHQSAERSMSYDTDGDNIYGVGFQMSVLFFKSDVTQAFQTRSMPTSGGAFRSIACGNGVVVVGGNDGRIYVSTNKGVSWGVTGINYPNVTNGFRIAFLLGKFYAWGYDSSVLGYYFFSSIDGASWSYIGLFGPNYAANPLKNINNVMTDGLRILIDDGGAWWVFNTDNSMFKLSFVPGNIFSSIYANNPLRLSDGLAIGKSNSQTFFSRAKIAPNRDTEFQVPKLTSNVNFAKRYIRGRV